MPVPLALLCCTLAGFLLLAAAGIGTSSLQPDLEVSRVPLAFVAGVLLLLATGLIVVAVRASTGRGARARIGAETRSLLAVVATTGLLLAAYFFVAAAPGVALILGSLTVTLWEG